MIFQWPKAKTIFTHTVGTARPRAARDSPRRLLCDNFDDILKSLPMTVNPKIQEAGILEWSDRVILSNGMEIDRYK